MSTLLLTGRHNIVLAMNVLLVVALLILGPICARAYGATGIAVVTASIIAMINLLAWAITKATVGVWTNATLRLSG